ncbi:MAG: DegV family protein [Oscillospiraceae bacterium]
MAIKIIADSCCDTTEELRKELDIDLVPLTIMPAPGVEFLDDLNINIGSLLSEMAKTKEPTRTACPSVDEYARRMEAYDESVVITLSDKLSGSHNSARLAREMVLEKHPDKKIFVIDSKSASAGELLIALFVNKLNKENVSFENVVTRVNEYIGQMNTLFVLQDLSNMVKNGRVSKVKGIMASVMSLHPVLSDDGNGEVKNLKTVRGLQNALDQMVSCIVDLTKNLPPCSTVLTLTYCNCRGRAETLKLDMMAKCKAIKEIIMAPTAGISTVYASDGGVVIAF